MALAVMPVPPHLLPAKVAPDSGDVNFTSIPHHLSPQQHSLDLHRHATSPTSDRSHMSDGPLSQRQSRNGSTQSSPRVDTAMPLHDTHLPARPPALLTPPWPSPALLAPVAHHAHPPPGLHHVPHYAHNEPPYDPARLPFSPYHHLHHHPLSPPPLHIMVPPVSPHSPAFAPMLYHPASAPASRRVSAAGLPSPAAFHPLSSPTASHIPSPAVAVDPVSEKNVPAPDSAPTVPVAHSKTRRKSTPSHGLQLLPSTDKEGGFDKGGEEEASMASSRQSSTRNQHRASAPRVLADPDDRDNRDIADDSDRDGRHTAKALLYLSSCAPLVSFAWALYTLGALLFLAIASPIYCCIRRRSHGVFSSLATSALTPFLRIQLACSGSPIRPPHPSTASSTSSSPSAHAHNHTSINLGALVLAAIGSPFISLVLAVSGIVVGGFWLLNMIIMETEKGVDDGKMLANKVIALWIGWLVWPLRTSRSQEQRMAQRRRASQAV